MPEYKPDRNSDSAFVVLYLIVTLIGLIAVLATLLSSVLS